MTAPASSFLLIFRDGVPSRYHAMSAEQRQQLLLHWSDWYDNLSALGKVQHGHPLDPGGRVVSGARGTRIIDGPFAEAKEVIGGYFLLTVADLDEATEIARDCPGLPYGITVEVRRISDACPRLQAERSNHLASRNTT